MTYKGIEIGDRPTGGQVEELVKESGYPINAFDAFRYWANRGWKTKKGAPLSSLECAMTSYYGIVAARKPKKLRKLERQLKGKNPTKLKIISVSPTTPVPEKPVNYKEEYAKMLKDPRWYAFRTFIFEVRGTTCECCGSKNNLQVHHIKYVYGRKPWEYTCNEVEVLCRQCHAAEHGITENN